MTNQESQDEVELGRLLRAVGPRPAPSVESAAAIRSAVEAEWRSNVARRPAGLRLGAWAAAATIAGALALGWWMSGAGPSAPAAQFASVATTIGSVERFDTPTATWQTIEQGSPVNVGDRLRTGATGRVAMLIEGGPALRVDRNSELALVDPANVTLRRGAAYVDSRETARKLVIDTPFGAVTHLGTRYFARVDPAELVVGVREGTVRVADGGRVTEVVGGQALTLPASGSAVRRDLPSYASEWDWVEAVAPSPEIEGMSLADFVQWVGHESGRSVQFASPEVEQAARAVILHGSVAGLPPRAALDAIMATSRLVHRVQDGVILLELEPAVR